MSGTLETILIVVVPSLITLVGVVVVAVVKRRSDITDAGVASQSGAVMGYAALVDDLQEQFVATRTRLTDQLAEQRNIVANLTKSNDTQRMLLAAQQIAIEGLAADKNDITSRLEELQASNKLLTAQVRSLVEDNGRLREKIDMLTAENRKLQGMINGLAKVVK